MMNKNSRPYPTRAARQAEILMQIVHQTEAAVQNQEAADNTLSELFRKNKQFGSRDRRLYSDAVFAWFRWYGWTKTLRKNSPETALCLSWLLSYEEIPDSIAYLLENALMDTSTWHTLHDQPLNKRASCLTSWGKLQATPDLLDLAPAWLGSCLMSPGETTTSTYTERFIESLLCRPPTWLSAPPSLADQLPDKLEQAGLAHTIHPYLKTAFFLDNPFALPELCKQIGKGIIIQDLASQCVGMACTPEPGTHWWDTCAGAGGKSIHLAQLMNNQGHILATDIRSNALRQIHRRAKEAQVTMIKMKQSDVIETTDRDTLFDGVLVDAPCSGIGTWGRNPDMRWRTTADNPRNKAALQQQILHHAAQQVKKGGALIYAVCTNTTVETIDVIDDFLAEHPQFSLNPIAHPLTGTPTDGQLWIWPWDGPCNGMYIACMKAEN